MTRVSVASWPPSIKRPARRSGVSGRFLSQASRVRKHGRDLRSNSRAQSHGSPAPTIQTSTPSTGKRAIPATTSTATAAPVTTFTPARCWRSTRRLGSSSGITSSRRTMSGTGTRPRPWRSSILCGKAEPASFLSRQIVRIPLCA